MQDCIRSQTISLMSMTLLINKTVSNHKQKRKTISLSTLEPHRLSATMHQFAITEACHVEGYREH